MVGYVTLGTNDLERATAFYEDLLGELGAKRFLGNERLVAWGVEPGAAMLAVCKPYDENDASVGNGVMVALNAGDQDTVRRVYAKALELGATDDGPPGPRGDAGFYGGYFRDLDGNKLLAFCMG